MNILYLPIDIDLTDLRFSTVEGSPVISKFNPFWNSTLINEEICIKNNFDKILNKLPFKNIKNIQYKIQQKEVGPHVDVYPNMILEDGEYQHIRENEPSGYRIILQGKNDSLEVFSGKKWVVAPMPEIPCCYLINATEGTHRVKSDSNRTLIYLRGILDREKHKKLIEKSLKKYQDFAIMKD